MKICLVLLARNHMRMQEDVHPWLHDTEILIIVHVDFVEKKPLGKLLVASSFLQM